MPMADVSFGIVGLGNIGAKHVRNLVEGLVPGARLAAVAARRGVPDGLTLPPDVRVHESAEALACDADVEAVLVATPTFEHLTQGLAVLGAGKHLLMEKPLALCTTDAKALLSAAGDRVFGVVLNQRLDPAYAAIRALVQTGRLGRLQRVSWTMTQWYRPDVYFRVSAWRGTWRGEGGGLLLNQCIHNLDVLQWLAGMPASVHAQADFGRHHDIEVEDEVSAWLAWPDGATGVIQASTGEAPGINQLDLVGDLGTLRYDGERIRLATSEDSVTSHCRNTRELFGMPDFDNEVLNGFAPVNQHALLLENFAAAVRGRAPLNFPAVDGLGSLMLANAMLLSAWRGETVKLPLDDAAYAQQLDRKIAASQLREPEDLEVHIDIEQSFR